jgi:UDP-3-O-[3-hydroxymyristoyl] glucosamine N-acyltransferase
MRDQKRKQTLLQYIESNIGVDTSSIRQILTAEKEKQKPGALLGEQIRPLLGSAMSADDIVAVATIIRTYADRRDQSLFVDISKLLEDCPLVGTPPSLGDEVKSITIISAATDGHHLKLVFAFAAALLAQATIEKVRIVFTGEWVWPVWSKVNTEAYLEKLKAAFETQLGHYPDVQPYMATLEQRLEILSAPAPNEMAALLGDIVIRFEGPAAFKTTYIFGKAIHKVRPVVTATFSSHVNTLRNCDLVLARAISKNESLVHYIPPAALALPLTPPVMDVGAEILLVSVYSQDRIKRGLASIKPNEWDAFGDLFDKHPNVRWLLVGASDPGLARAAIPAQFVEKYGKRIEILAFSSLDEIYRKAFVFLSLPKVFGGAGGATMAISSGVPVLTDTDERSDIANTLPETLHIKNLVDAINTVKEWVDAPQLRYNFVADQQRFLAGRMNLEEKGKELLRHLSSVFKKRRTASEQGAKDGDSGLVVPLKDRFEIVGEKKHILGGKEAELTGLADLRLQFAGLARLGYTKAGDLCFCDREPGVELEEVAAGTIILCTEALVGMLSERFPGANCLPLPDPRATFIDLGRRLLAEGKVEVSVAVPRPFGIHPTVQVGEQTVIHPETRIDANVKIGAQCVIHRGTWLQAGAVIRDNTVVGVEGINAYKGLDGKQRSFPHFASVIIGENVEIGAGAVVVRGILNSTRIGKDSVIGNLSNIGHVVEIGEKVWMSVGCLIGGHTRIGAGATLGMGVAVKDNIEIGEKAQVGMASVVVKSVAAGTSVFGNPARAIPSIQAGPAR